MLTLIEIKGYKKVFYLLKSAQSITLWYFTILWPIILL